MYVPCPMGEGPQTQVADSKTVPAWLRMICKVEVHSLSVLPLFADVDAGESM